MTRALITAVFLLATPFTFAGGSLPTEEALAMVCEKDQILCQMLKTMPLGPVAGALRDREGYRKFPLEFLTEDGTKLIEVEIQKDGRLSATVKANDDVFVDPGL